MIFLILLVLVLLTAAVAAVTLLGARREAVAAGGSDSDSQSFVGGVLNALFTVLLAFYIVFAWQNGDDVDKAAQQEVNALNDAYWQVSAVPAEQAASIRSLAEQYAHRVAEHEWAALGQGRGDAEADRLLVGLRAEAIALPADTEVQKSAREQVLADVRQIDEGHRERVDVATDDQSFNVVLLVGSILGAVLMIVFPLLVGLSARPANVVTMALLTLTLGFTIYLSVQLMHPLQGPFGVDPDSFRTFLEALPGGTSATE
ncbi:bestrophin-like domain [Saccharopolyspora sp. NPDC002578]